MMSPPFRLNLYVLAQRLKLCLLLCISNLFLGCSYHSHPFINQHLEVTIILKILYAFIQFILFKNFLQALSLGNLHTLSSHRVQHLMFYVPQTICAVSLLIYLFQILSTNFLILICTIDLSCAHYYIPFFGQQFKHALYLKKSVLLFNSFAFSFH